MVRRTVGTIWYIESDLSDGRGRIAKENTSDTGRHSTMKEMIWHPETRIGGSTGKSIRCLASISKCNVSVIVIKEYETSARGP